jgi:single-strand DNA-binding protein
MRRLRAELAGLMGLTKWACPPVRRRGRRRRSIACTGRLGGAPETKYTSGGKQQLVFSVAVDANTTTTEERPKADTLWLRVTAWEETAAALTEVLAKATVVYLEGRLRHDRWEAQDGTPWCGLSVSAWKVEPLGLIGKRAPRREVAAVGNDGERDGPPF